MNINCPPPPPPPRGASSLRRKSKHSLTNSGYFPEPPYAHVGGATFDSISSRQQNHGLIQLTTTTVTHTISNNDDEGPPSKISRENKNRRLPTVLKPKTATPSKVTNGWNRKKMKAQPQSLLRDALNENMEHRRLELSQARGSQIPNIDFSRLSDETLLKIGERYNVLPNPNLTMRDYMNLVICYISTMEIDEEEVKSGFMYAATTGIGKRQ